MKKIVVALILTASSLSVQANPDFGKLFTSGAFANQGNSNIHSVKLDDSNYLIIVMPQDATKPIFYKIYKSTGSWKFVRVHI